MVTPPTDEELARLSGYVATDPASATTLAALIDSWRELRRRYEDESDSWLGDDSDLLT